MKKIIIFILLLNYSCSIKSGKKIDSQKVNTEYSVDNTSFDWLLGDWIRINEEESKQTFEQWLKKDSMSYEGWGYTLQKNDTIFQEYMKLSRTDSLWTLTVTSPAENNKTSFSLSEYTEESFTVANTSHDFPTHIQYQSSKDTLRASVYNSDMRIHFLFIKR